MEELEYQPLRLGDTFVPNLPPQLLYWVAVGLSGLEDRYRSDGSPEDSPVSLVNIGVVELLEQTGRLCFLEE